METRKIIKYSDEETNILNLKKNIMMLEIQLMGYKTKLFDNQIITAEEIIENFDNRKIINQMVLGQTQSGKTGCMLATMNLFTQKNVIPIENIYIITGLSSVEWKQQTLCRFPIQLEKHIYHRNELTKTFITEIKNKQNVLILMDEMHLAAKCNQTIHKTLKELGYLDKQFLLDHDIKILEFTATPDGTIYDLMKWNENSCIIKMKNGLEYKGSYELYKNNQLKQYKNLLEDDNISELVKEINNYSNSYHIIRTRKDEIDDIAYALNKRQKYNYIYYDQKMKTNINDILEVKPDKNTVIKVR